MPSASENCAVLAGGNMDRTQLLIIVVFVALIVIAISAYFTMRRRRSLRLRERFGPEYDRVVRHEGDVRKGEGVLEFREKRRDHFRLRPLSPVDKSSFDQRWNEVQARFVDDPKCAVTVADSLVMEVMQARGYPVGSPGPAAARRKRYRLCAAHRFAGVL